MDLSLAVAVRVVTRKSGLGVAMSPELIRECAGASSGKLSGSNESLDVSQSFACFNYVVRSDILRHRLERVFLLEEQSTKVRCVRNQGYDEVRVTAGDRAVYSL